MNNRVKANICLFATAILWGFAFVAQRSGMDSIPPFLFSSIRLFIGAAAMGLICCIGNMRKKDSKKVKTSRKTTLIGGTSAGIVMFAASNLQQVGLVYVDAGKTAFVTALYILIVPVLGIFIGRKSTIFNWIGAGAGTVGLYLLCITESFDIAKGDFIVLIGSLFWAVHILVFDHFTLKVDATKLVAMQSLVAGILSLIVSLSTETATMQGIIETAPNLLYTGVVSTGIAFTLQAVGQKYANPTTASIILSTESLFGALCGFVFLHEVMSGRELWGAVIMLAAIFVSQIPAKSEKM